MLIKNIPLHSYENSCAFRGKTSYARDFYKLYSESFGPGAEAVFTTKYVLERQSPIVYVSHDENGDWQFFGKEQNITEEDARVIAFGEILKISPLVEKILWITERMQAWLSETNEWQTSLFKSPLK